MQRITAAGKTVAAQIPDALKQQGFVKRGVTRASACCFNCATSTCEYCLVASVVVVIVVTTGRLIFNVTRLALAITWSHLVGAH